MSNPFNGIMPRPLGYLAYVVVWCAAMIALALAYLYAFLTGDWKLNGKTWWRKDPMDRQPHSEAEAYRYINRKIERDRLLILAIIGAIIMAAGIAYVVADVLTGGRPADTQPTVTLPVLPDR